MQRKSRAREKAEIHATNEKSKVTTECSLMSNNGTFEHLHSHANCTSVKMEKDESYAWTSKKIRH